MIEDDQPSVTARHACYRWKWFSKRGRSVTFECPDCGEERTRDMTDAEWLAYSAAFASDPSSGHKAVKFLDSLNP